MYSMSTWDPAITAEVEYRTQRLTDSYRRGAPRPVRSLAAWVRSRFGRERTRRAVERIGATMDAVAARSDSSEWDRQVTRRATQIAGAMDALQPQDGAGRRAA